MTRSSALFLATITAALVLAVVLSIYSGESSVQAVPQPPHIFFGAVTGASPGQTIHARINDVNYAQSVQFGVATRSTTVESDFKYGQARNFQVCADTPDFPEKEGGVDGDIIVFFIGDKRADAYLLSGELADPVKFQRGGLTHLDLVFNSSNLVDTATASAFACKVGDELPPTPVPTVPTGVFFTPFPPTAVPDDGVILPTATPEPDAAVHRGGSGPGGRCGGR